MRNTKKIVRYLCLPTLALTINGTLPRFAMGEVFPLQVVKTLAEARKPNVLVVLETAESMQGLSGENWASYNQVGADCDDGSRNCRLVGQAGRWAFSGMGSLGMSFASQDTETCNSGVNVSGGFCNEATTTPCGNDGGCVSVPGDFCRHISLSDGSGRTFGDVCSEGAGPTWGQCKQGVTTKGSGCTGPSDSTCENALSDDFCVAGQPATMCSETGLWCLESPHCPGGPTDTCIPATSRLMQAKRALRRALSQYSDEVNIGFMTSYQGKGIGSTNPSTEIYPYVKLQSCPSSNNVTETKFLSRGELELAGCFTLSSGPSASCTIDYGGNGALNATASLNQIVYSFMDTLDSLDSRWAIPRQSGSNSYDHQDADWSTCDGSPILPSCALSTGTGRYLGSYYTFSYRQGTPISNGGVDGEGSRAHPIYFTTYKGKYFDAGGGNCYNALEVDRTDNVNDNIYGRPAYTGTPYMVPNQVGVPWSGSTNPSTCNATTGALWTSNAVPFLTDTTFGGRSVDTSQKALMTIARLEKASQGGVYATGSLAPLGCMLNNEGAATAQTSAATYLAQVNTVQTAQNGGLAVCQPDNILLIVDGLSNGPGDFGGSVDCGSAACNPRVTPDLLGCNCSAITKAYQLSHAAHPVTTHVVAAVPATWSTPPSDPLSYSPYYYVYAFLVNLAAAGSTDFSGSPGFGVTEEQLHEAITAKLAQAIAPFGFSTTNVVAGSDRQNSLGVVSQSTYLFDTATSYPSWKGELRAFDTSSGTPSVLWNATTVAASHPSSWKGRRVLVGDSSGGLFQVQIDDTGLVTNKEALYSAGLGSSANEAETIMQWLLGKSEFGRVNPTPLLGSISNSTPIAVGQPSVSSAFPGSLAFSQSKAARPELVYVGDDQGILHAFFSRNFAGSPAYAKGEEAFAFIPNDMLRRLGARFAEGGQSIIPESGFHRFGVSSSPKVKDLCQGSNCADSDGSDWRTILYMGEGAGGNRPFALDITNAIDPYAGLRLNQISLRWNPGVLPASGAQYTLWNQSLGETRSVPALYFNKTTSYNDYRVVMASGYKVDSTSSTQGLRILNANAYSGTVDANNTLNIPTAPEDCKVARPTLTKTVLAAVSLARNFQSSNQEVISGYVGDTWGNLYQYVPNHTGTGRIDGPTTTGFSGFQLGCGQPLHFAPAVVQLDRFAGNQSPIKGVIFLVQVTNSALDPVTVTKSGSYPASQLMVTKLIQTSAPIPTVDSAWNAGKITLSAEPADPKLGICVNTGMKTANDACASGEAIPTTVRPMATPTVLLRSDGLGFQVLTLWWDPESITNDCSGSKTFNVGKSYLTVHEFSSDGIWYQIMGAAFENSVVTGATFVGTHLYVDGILNGSSSAQAVNIGETFSPTQKLNSAKSIERYTKTGWSEFWDL